MERARALDQTSGAASTRVEKQALSMEWEIDFWQRGTSMSSRQEVIFVEDAREEIADGKDRGGSGL